MIKRKVTMTSKKCSDELPIAGGGLRIGHYVCNDCGEEFDFIEDEDGMPASCPGCCSIDVVQLFVDES